MNYRTHLVAAALLTATLTPATNVFANCGEIPGVPTTGETCGGYVAAIVDQAGTLPTTGNAIVTNDETGLYVDVTMNYDPTTGTGYLAQAVSVYASPIDPETADAIYDNHQPDYSKFQHLSWFSDGTSAYQAYIPYSTIGIEYAPRTTLDIMVYVRVLTVSNWVVTSTQDLYAFGSGFTSYPCGGGYFEYNLCGGGDESYGCTYTQGYWRTHNSASRVLVNRVAWPVVDATDTMDENDKLCSGDSRTLLTLMKTAPKLGDAYLILVHQYIAAKLNVASGASTTAEVENAIDESWTLIQNNCGATVQSSTDTGGLMLIYAGILDAYNNGDVGPGHCE